MLEEIINIQLPVVLQVRTHGK